MNKQLGLSKKDTVKTKAIKILTYKYIPKDAFSYINILKKRRHVSNTKSYSILNIIDTSLLTKSSSLKNRSKKR